MCENLDEFKIIFDQLNKLLQQDSNSVELDWKYFKEVFNQAKNIKHVVIGESPYPKDASGIPFIKKTEKFNLKSIGNAGIEILRKEKIKIPSNLSVYKNPSDFAKNYLLSKKKVALLNISYFHKIRGKHISIEEINFCHSLNSKIIREVKDNENIKFITIGVIAHKIFCQIYAQSTLNNYDPIYHPSSNKKFKSIGLSQ